MYLTVNERSPTLCLMDSHHLRKIQAFYRSHKRMPSYSELMAVVGFRSKNAASKLVERFVQRDWLEKDDKGRLLPGRLFQDLPLLGTVSAGFPSPADEELLDTITLDEYLIRNRASTFLVQAQGDSMIGACILPGDLVLVDRARQARDGDIVIAAVDGGWTMKYLRKKGGRITLEAANRKYPPIEPQSELVIEAVVTAVIRKIY